MPQLLRRTLRIATSIVLAAAPLVAAQGVRALTDSLTDREFWDFFTNVSEASGDFPSENFVSNEKTYQYVIPTLQRTLTPNGVYVGVGPEQNFTYIANLEPSLAVIIDIRRQNAMLHLMYKALFELSATRAEFVSRLFSRPMPLAVRAISADSLFAEVGVARANDSAFAANWDAIVYRLTVTRRFAMSADDIASMRRVYATFFEAGPDISYAYHLGQPPSPTAWLVSYAQIQTATNADSVTMSFLATDDRYRVVRSLELRNLIVPVVGDFGGPKAIRGVGEYLANRGAVVTAFYVSNVEQYLFTGMGAEQRFYRSVAALPLDSTSTFIRSLPSPGPAVNVQGLPVIPPNTGALRIVDSAGVRILSGTIDSAGRVTTWRVVTPAPPPRSNPGAFISGIAPIQRTLDAFAANQLRTYARVTAMTKTDGWKP
ncbi:MAG: hypothetical protein ACREPM_24770 [Gemmatimonadaceae bacterium]